MVRFPKAAMNLSLENFALATLPPAMFALALGILLRQRSLLVSVLVFVLGGVLSFVLSTLLTRVSSGWMNHESMLIGEPSLLNAVPGTVSAAARDAMFDAALPEEAGRFLVLFVIYGSLRGFRRRADIVLFGSLIALGFAAVESALYALTSSGAVETLMRIIPTLSHGFDGLIMAAFLAQATVADRQRWLFVGLALLIPVFLHFLFDFGQFSAEALGPRIESIDPEAAPTPATLVLLGSALILILSPIIVWIVEAVAAVLIVRSIRRDLKSSAVTQQPIVSV